MMKWSVLGKFLMLFLVVVFLILLTYKASKIKKGSNNLPVASNETETAISTMLTEKESLEVTPNAIERSKLSEICFNALTKTPLKSVSAKTPTGLVTGSVYYPGEGLSEGLQVCAYDINNGVRYCTSDFTNLNQDYNMQLPEGKYYIYLLTEIDAIGVGGLNKDDYQTYSDRSGNEVGKAPLIIQVIVNTSTDNIDVGDDLIFREKLYCPEIY